MTKLIRVRAWVTDTIEDWLSSKKRVVQLHDKHGARQLLVDIRDQESAPSTSDIRTAILVGEKTGEEQLFLETTAINRGRQMRTFDNEADALNWLRE